MNIPKIRTIRPIRHITPASAHERHIDSGDGYTYCFLTMREHPPLVSQRGRDGLPPFLDCLTCYQNAPS
jgi:hypothetical protein